jgi:hypothetical protein
MLFASRLLRFGAEAYLARRFGPQTLDWLESPIVQNAVLGFVVLAAVLTIVTIIRIVRSSPRSSRGKT